MNVAPTYAQNGPRSTTSSGLRPRRNGRSLENTPRGQEERRRGGVAPATAEHEDGDAQQQTSRTRTPPNAATSGGPSSYGWSTTGTSRTTVAPIGDRHRLAGSQVRRRAPARTDRPPRPPSSGRRSPGPRHRPAVATWPPGSASTMTDVLLNALGPAEVTPSEGVSTRTHRPISPRATAIVATAPAM